MASVLKCPFWYGLHRNYGLVRFQVLKKYSIYFSKLAYVLALGVCTWFSPYRDSDLESSRRANTPGSVRPIRKR